MMCMSTVLNDLHRGGCKLIYVRVDGTYLKPIKNPGEFVSLFNLDILFVGGLQF